MRTKPKTPFTYECHGDSDGELVGYDHFVLDADGNELCIAPDEDTGRLFAASPRLLEACETLVRLIEYVPDITGMIKPLELKARVETVIRDAKKKEPS